MMLLHETNNYGELSQFLDALLVILVNLRGKREI